jgi:hypothetical protein
MSQKRERKLRREAREAAARPSDFAYSLPIRHVLGETPAMCWADLFGADPDFTGGLGVDEYLEASRGEA